MSGSIGSISSFFSNSLNTGTSLLDTLYGIGTPTGATTGEAALQALSLAEKNQTKDVSLTAKEPIVQHAVAAFTKGVNEAKTLAQLLANPAVMQVLLTANGLGDQLAYKALATKVLTSNLKDPKSIANILTDPRWKTLAKTFNFAANGLSAIKNADTIAKIAGDYAQITWQKSQDAVTPGLSKALAFRAKASTINSVVQILGDPIMRDVVTVALGIPKQIAFQTLNAQELSISSRLDIKQFQNPSFVETFAQRYLIANSALASSTSSTPDLTTLAIQGRGLLV